MCGSDESRWKGAKNEVMTCVILTGKASRQKVTRSNTSGPNRLIFDQATCANRYCHTIAPQASVYMENQIPLAVSGHPHVISCILLVGEKMIKGGVGRR